MSSLTKTLAINSKKLVFRCKYTEYLSRLDGYDCGASLAATVSPAIGKLAQEINVLAQELKALDPQFPASWTSLPEGA